MLGGSNGASELESSTLLKPGKDHADAVFDGWASTEFYAWQPSAGLADGAGAIAPRDTDELLA